MKKHIIFDLDGTLIDSMPVWKNIAGEYIQKYNLNAPDNLNEIVKKQTLPETAAYFKKQFSISKEVDEIVTEIISMVAQQYHCAVPLKPYAKQYLEKEKQNGSKMCILTASEPSYIFSAMKRLDIIKYFSFIATCTEMGLTKNDREAFSITMQRLGGKKENTIIFEDALYAIDTAKKDNFYVIAVSENTRAEDKLQIQQLADRYIYSYKELL